MTVQLTFLDGTTRVYADIASIDVDRECAAVDMQAGTPRLPWLMLLRDVVRLVVL